MTLPSDRDLPVEILSQLLADTTNSYKFLFMLSLLDSVQASYGDDERWRTVSLRDLAVGMLAHAWLPLKRFHLSFGLQDQTLQILNSALAGSSEKFSYEQQGQIRLRTWLLQSLSAQHVRDLTRYVPKRLIRPFFANELAGVRDSEVNARLVSLAEERFDLSRPLYRLQKDRLELHPQWHSYLRRHLGVVRGWVCWHWAQYLQSRNPNVPAIPNKLFPLDTRASLERQWKFWKHVLRDGSVRCIYSGLPLNAEESALDHFLPWSFVAHDQLRNLVPVSGSANSSKGDRIPHPSYLVPFTRLQARALVVARPAFEKAEWYKIIEPYLADLRVPEDVLTGSELSLERLESSLAEQFELTLPSLMSLAACNGFSSGWTYT